MDSSMEPMSAVTSAGSWVSTSDEESAVPLVVLSEKSKGDSTAGPWAVSWVSKRAALMAFPWAHLWGETSECPLWAWQW